MIPNWEPFLILGKKAKMTWEYGNINMFSKWEFRIPIREMQGNRSAWKPSAIINERNMKSRGNSGHQMIC